MQLMTLDSNFQPVKMIENYESLLWTERYFDNGDFELVSSDINRCMQLMPRESYVSLVETTVPMVVETYSIKKPLGDGPKITIKGRAFESVLERRASVITLPATAARAVWTILADKESDAAYKAIRMVIGDVARSQGGIEVLPAVSPAVSPLDAIPEIDLPLPADYSTGLSNTYEIQAGRLYDIVLDMIKTNHHGIKATRPLPGDTKTDIEIYNGADLTNEVVFDARFDQFDDSTYLLSAQGSMNVGYIYGGSGGSNSVRKNNVGDEVSGLSRRVLLLDGQSTSADIRTSQALIELYKYNATALFDGEIAYQIAAGFGTKYHLGDILKLVGEYGLSADVRVSEYIRSSDADGEKAYPTFEVIDTEA